MPKILRSVLAGVVAWLILFGVGQLLDSYLWTGNELDRWTYTTWLAAVCGFAVDRASAAAPATRSHRARAVRNIIFGAGWAGLAFLLSEAFDVIAGDDRQGSSLRDWAGVAIAVPVVVGFWAVFLRGSPTSKRDPGKPDENAHVAKSPHPGRHARQARRPLRNPQLRRVVDPLTTLEGFR